MDIIFNLLSFFGVDVFFFVNTIKMGITTSDETSFNLVDSI
jgi:hypothetical protein